MFELTQKIIDETRQGEAFAINDATEQHYDKKFYIESYGCQMNFSDTEIIASMLKDMGFGFTNNENQADLILLNTCSIRENAESKIWNRLKQLRARKPKTPL
jgi:tRNA-2-methylthio-N6-dimethylallyladenosine synthase